MNTTVICPLYNAENYIINLDKSIHRQKNVEIKEIKYILTESSDNTEELLKDLKANYSVISKSEFSHSIVREKTAFLCNTDTVTFVTQDVEIKRDDWLENLIKPIYNEGVAATYSRQICDNKSIEKYTREKNYPSKSYIVSNKDIDKLGLRTFFFSDASSAINLSIFKLLNGYDGKDLPTNEDMYIAYKIITNGYKIKYCADSIVTHSHDFTFGEYYNRYKLTGKFFKENKYLDKYGTNKTGGGMAKYVLKRAMQDRNYSAIVKFLPNMLARFVGMKMGKI